MKVTYTGHRTLWFPDYIDLGTGKILAAEPGGTYSIEPVGYNAPDYPVDGFTPVGSQEDLDAESDDEILLEQTEAPPEDIDL